MITVDYEHCSGCGACVQRCPKNCISWEYGEFGFGYPLIDKSRCVNCGLCDKVCPIGKELNISNRQQIFAVVHKNQDLLTKSTSGGAFGAIAQFVLEHDGTVYGCNMDDGMQVKHIRIENVTDIDKLRGSKYVQSSMEHIYIDVEKDLLDGRWVLYSGTPCQISGLNHFLDKEYRNLVTIDIICHGVGSQQYFDKFMDNLRFREGHVKEVKFRSKKYVGWSCGGEIISLTDNVKKEKVRPFYSHENYYYSYFLTGDIYRKACYSCPYATIERQGDITLGDFWGVEGLKMPIDFSKGCSLVLVNTEKGKLLFEQLKDIEWVETTIDVAVKCNQQLSHPTALPKTRQRRIHEFETMDGNQIQMEYLMTHKKNLIKGKFKTIIPYRLKLKLRGMRR